MGQKFDFFIVIKFIIKTLELGNFQALLYKAILAQGAKIRVKTHGLNPNFCARFETCMGRIRNWLTGFDSGMGKKQTFRVFLIVNENVRLNKVMSFAYL